MGKRHTARLLAMQTLYQLDFGETKTENALATSLSGKSSSLEAKSFAEKLVDVVTAHRKEIDVWIARHLSGYKLTRLGGVDRNILRLAAAELAYLKEASPSVIINEAIELSKEFSSEEGAHFINGVLDAMRKEKEAEHVHGDH